jgi:predicted RND superfamily exporter protein
VRPLRVAAVTVLALAGAALALTLKPSTGIGTFVSGSSPDYQATQAAYRQFGADPVVVLVQASRGSLIATRTLAVLGRLETCLGGTCGGRLPHRPAAFVYGPDGFLTHAVSAVDAGIRALTRSAAGRIRAAEAAARTLAGRQGLSSAETQAAVSAAGQLALERELSSLGGITSALDLKALPSLHDEAFLRQIASNPNFAYLFPNSHSALIQVRLRPDLSDAEQTRAIDAIKAAVALPRFRIRGVTYTVTGEPVVLTDLGSELSGQLALLLVAAIVVMALVLLLAFRRRLRLLPLLLALDAIAITFGLTALVGATLTVAAIAVIPVLIGLAVDYAVQFRSGTPRGAIAIAALATTAGFLALLISPVPMVRGFGLLLIAGVVIAFAISWAVIPRGPGERLDPPHRPEALIASVYGAGEILRGALPVITRHPRRILAIALVLATVGWVADTQTSVQSDITKLVPRGMPALQHLNALERTTGSSGGFDVLVHAPDVTRGSVVNWMRSYERQVSDHFGYSSVQGCAHATLCPALSLPTLLQTADGTLSAVPGYFQRAVLTPDHRYAVLAFGIRLMPLSEQRRVIAYMRAALNPPQGTSAALTGLPVLAADADGSLSSSSRRLLMLLVGLVVVGLALLAALRHPRRALVPLVPIVLATGWSALLVYALQIPLNPLSATFGTLVIAITTEFSVLLSERVCRQRGMGMSRAEALDNAYSTTGVAVLTSAATAIAGFGVLILSDVPLLRDFGLLTLIDLSVSLAGVMVVLPAVLAVIELKPQR